MPKPMDRPNRVLWTAQPDPDYAGKPCIVVGGGPSLMGFEFRPFMDVPTIAVNQAFQIAPHAGYLMFADRRWYNWNQKPLRSFAGHKVTVGAANFPEEQDIKRMTRMKDDGLCLDRTQLAGIDSGCIAVNLAYHLGASRIILLGFDSDFSEQGKSHFHNCHQVAANRDYYRYRYGPRLVGMAQRLRDRGVPVVRSTPPGMADIPYVPLPESLTADLPPVKGWISAFEQFDGTPPKP